MIAILLRAIARQAATIHRQEAEIARLARGYRKANLTNGVAVATAKQANDNTDRAIEHAKGWRSRAEALYEIADRDLRDGVMGCLASIEALPETKERT